MILKLGMKKLIILFSFFFILCSFVDEVHPYHVGSVEFKYNENNKTFEITGRFFLDDLENALSKKYGTTLHFQDEQYKTKMNDYLDKYCMEYLRLKVDNQFIKVKYLGYEEDRESVDIYLESEKINSPKKVETAVSFLYNLFDDQINLVHIIVNGERKSSKLNYPDRYLYQKF